MKDQINDILSVKDVHGVILFSNVGELLFKEFKTRPLNDDHEIMALSELTQISKQAFEIDILFENKRIYMRKVRQGFLITIMKPEASIAMVRLNCDMVISNLEIKKQQSGLGRFFKKKKSFFLS